MSDEKKVRKSYFILLFVELSFFGNLLMSHTVKAGIVFYHNFKILILQNINLTNLIITFYSTLFFVSFVSFGIDYT